MTATLDSHAFQSRLQRLDALLHEAEGQADPAAHARTAQLVQAVIELHGAGLERMLECLTTAGEVGREVLDACARDEAAAGMLLLHGLHPLGVEERVQEALHQVRPYLSAHGGDVELLGIEDGVVQLRLEGNCNGCASSLATMQHTIEEAIIARAPDVTAVRVEGLPQPTMNGARVALPLV